MVYTNMVISGRWLISPNKILDQLASCFSFGQEKEQSAVPSMNNSYISMFKMRSNCISSFYSPVEVSNSGLQQCSSDEVSCLVVLRKRVKETQHFLPSDNYLTQ